MVQYLQNNVIMKWTTRFIRFTGWIPLKHGLVFHITIPKTSNIRRTLSFELLTDEFSNRISIIRRALY